MKNKNNSISQEKGRFENSNLNRKPVTLVTIVTFLINKIKYNRLTASKHVTKAVTKIVTKFKVFENAKKQLFRYKVLKNSVTV
jgi:hypothetical protein